MRDASEPPTLKERVEDVVALSAGAVVVVVFETGACILGRERMIKLVNRLRVKFL